MNKDETLRAVAERCEFDIGAFGIWAEYLDDERYRETLSSEFTMLTPGIALKMDQTRPSRDTYDFENADRIIDFGQKHGMKVRGHVLVWHQQLPTWFDPEDYTDDEVRNLLRDHIQMTVDRYEGRMCAWDVVNEAIGDDAARFVKHRVVRGTRRAVHRPCVSVGTRDGSERGPLLQ